LHHELALAIVGARTLSRLTTRAPSIGRDTLTQRPQPELALCSHNASWVQSFCDARSDALETWLIKLPAAISKSDEEMDDFDDVDVPDAIPARAPHRPAPKNYPSDDDEEDEEDDDEDGGDDEYQVEKILTHQYDQAGNVLYQIKWLGYDAESDMTWEPIDNLYVSKLCHDDTR
jgi:hypothetical protein